MPKETDALKPELIHSLGTLRSIDAVVWDVLGEHLAIRTQAGPLGGRTVPVTWSVPRELVATLHSLLGQALLDREYEERPRQ